VTDRARRGSSWWAVSAKPTATVGAAPESPEAKRRALLRGGEQDGTQILWESTVDAAFSNQIGDLNVPAEIPTADPETADRFLPGPGWKWGYGLLLNTEDLPARRRAWTGAWAGLFNTHFFVDRTTGICASIYTNSLPFVARDEAWKLYGDFEQAVYASL
jgi:methyl acetate hydrolase